MPDLKMQIIRAGLKELETHAREALRNDGFSDDVIDRAAEGQLTGGLWPTDDGEHVAGPWLHVETLRQVMEARKALERGETERAELHHAEAKHEAARAQINRDGPDRDRGRQFPPGKPQGAVSKLGRRIENFLKRKPHATKEEVERYLRYDCAELVTRDQRADTGLAFDGKPVSRRMIREHINKARERLAK